jgi:hypothetical protein
MSDPVAFPRLMARMRGGDVRAPEDLFPPI